MSISFNFEASNYINGWRNIEKYNDKLFADHSTLQAKSATSCGRLCTNIRKSSAFSSRKKNCYSYDSKPKNNYSSKNLRGAVYYTKKSVAKVIGN